MPVQDLLRLRRVLKHSSTAVPGPTIESELLSIVEDEVVRRGLGAADKVARPPAGT
jgi:hypothetical protein